MNKKIIILVTIIAVAGVLGFTQINKYSNKGNEAIVVNSLGGSKDSNKEAVVITAKHSFKNGTHIVAGEVNMPTPCDLLETKVLVKDFTPPEKIVLSFKTINQSEGLCEQVITPQRFKVSFEASKSAVISATLNLEDVTLNLIEAGPDEDLDNFEIYIKG